MSCNARIKFVCQREQGVFPVDSCHVACLYMLLEFIQFYPMPSYEALCHELKLAAPEGSYDNSLEEVLKFVVRHNIEFRIGFREAELEEALKVAPIMVAFYGAQRFWRREGHTVVLVGLEQDRFIYLDPWFSKGKHVKSLLKADFKKYFQGFYCQLLA